MITLEDVRSNPEIQLYIEMSNNVLGEIKYTEHGLAHATVTSRAAANILSDLDFEPHTVELAAIAGYMHDIGNCINRHDHAQTGAVMAFTLLSKMGMEQKDIATVITAIGNHDEGTGDPVSPISAALILADKSDVRRSRVRDRVDIGLDIHDRVNFAVTESSLEVLKENRAVILSLTIDTDISAVMDYFEIFLSRMLLCRKAAEYLGLQFALHINKTRLL